MGTVIGVDRMESHWAEMPGLFASSRGIGRGLDSRTTARKGIGGNEMGGEGCVVLRCTFLGRGGLAQTQLSASCLGGRLHGEDGISMTVWLML